jgi:SAM-dependent methyltransferase
VRRRLRAPEFDRLYAADPDPWDFATSPYERAKYDATIRALDGRRFARGLELGCSIGVLTERLAAHCDDLLAVDLADAALTQARARLADLPHVRVERREIPEEFPAGPFGLIVASEVLYYLDDPALEAAVEAIAAALEPGGSLLAVHWRPHTRTYPQRGDDVHARLAALGWPAGASERTPRYALDRLDRPA